MSSWIWIVLGTAVVGFVASLSFRGNPMKRALAHAKRTGEVGALVEAIEADSGDRATAWDKAISHLWQDYAREAAASLVVEAAARTNADVVQYWIRQVVEVEPEIAAEAFTPEFIEVSYKPEVAGRCGKSGCGCG